MTTISNIIEAFIKDLIKKSGGNLVEIQRNELAKYFNCAPSQINYVLMTRFTLMHGYSIESQRGGGGFIKIRQLTYNENSAIYRLMTEEIGNEISQQQANKLISILLEQQKITRLEAKMMKAAIEGVTIISSIEARNCLRASILKNMLGCLLEEA